MMFDVNFGNPGDPHPEMKDSAAAYLDAHEPPELLVGLVVPEVGRLPFIERN